MRTGCIYHCLGVGNEGELIASWKSAVSLKSLWKSYRYWLFFPEGILQISGIGFFFGVNGHKKLVTLRCRSIPHAMFSRNEEPPPVQTKNTEWEGDH
jgi:hypothetical protein